jgi:hypothetical protein
MFVAIETFSFPFLLIYTFWTKRTFDNNMAAKKKIEDRVKATKEASLNGDITEELLENSECKTAFNVSNDLVSEFDNKTKQYFTQDVISFTVLCLYKPNKEKFGLSE